MRFSPLYLYAQHSVGIDELGNPINELALIGESEGRFSSWTAEEIALDVRKLTMNSRKVLTRALKEDLEVADKVKIEGYYHSIKEIKGDDYGRWRLLVVSRYGSELP